jgi:hypothetical protein
MAYLGNAPFEGLVASDSIVDGSITTSKLQDTAVTYPKINSNVITTYIAEGTNLYYTDTRVANYLTSNSYATQGYVTTQITNLINSAPAALDTLNELAAALGNDASFATTVTNSLSGKLSTSGGTVSGNLNITGTLSIAGVPVSAGGGGGGSAYVWFTN